MLAFYVEDSKNLDLNAIENKHYPSKDKCTSDVPTNHKDNRTIVYTIPYHFHDCNHGCMINNLERSSNHEN
jgi:hypothetical protein